MKKEKKKKYPGGLIETVAIALLVLTGLRICGIRIPVFWILSPVWIPVVGIILYVAIYMLREVIREKRDLRRRKKWH